MQPFTCLVASAATLSVSHIDTDQILPARYMKTLGRAGLGRHLFHEWRYTADGHERPEFVLNQADWRGSGIIIAYENFGCGSSREHAVWALADFGIRCVIAPSFGDIFSANCAKNGILLVRLSHEVCTALMDETRGDPGQSLRVDLELEMVTAPSGDAYQFATDPGTRRMLLAGLDDISRTLKHEAAILNYETALNR